MTEIPTELIEVVFRYMPVRGKPASVLLNGQPRTIAPVTEVQTHPQYPGQIWVNTSLGERYSGPVVPGQNQKLVAGVIIGAGLLFLALVLFALLRASTSAPEQTSFPQCDASALYAEYKQNEIAADAKYKDKLIIVTGPVRKVGRDILGTPYVSLGGPLEVQCMFREEHAAPLAKLSVGQMVAVGGKCEGFLVEVILRDCRMAE